MILDIPGQSTEPSAANPGPKQQPDPCEEEAENDKDFSKLRHFAVFAGRI